MARLPRIDVPGVPQHLIVRGNNRTELFRDDADRLVFMSLMRQALEACACDLHAFVLMGNHVHLLATGHVEGEISELMQRIGRKFARLMNIRWGRTGTLFEGRFRSSLIDSDAYLLTCMRYIELNPVRAGIVDDPSAYSWSSYRENASPEDLERIREGARKCRAIGSESFRAEISGQLGRVVTARPQGRPKNGVGFEN